MIELPVDFYISAVGITVEIWNNNLKKFSKCDMVFDTGASMTTIDTSIAIRSGYNLIDAENVTVSGVGDGFISAKRIILRDFLIGGVAIGPVMVDVVDFPVNGNTFALLGMNVIKEFDVIARFKDKRPAPNKRDATIYLEPLFSLNDTASFDELHPMQTRFGVWSVGSKNTDI